MKYNTVVFDLDGTLLDSLDDIADSMNVSLTQLGFPVHDRNTYKTFVGGGIDAVASKALPEDKRTSEIISKCITIMREEYGHRWSNKTKPFPDIPQLLDSLTSRGIMMAILSNKLDPFTKKIARTILGSWYFHKVVGLRPDLPGKPDPRSACMIAYDLHVAPNKCLFVGDSDIDMITAHKAGMCPLGVLWGYQSQSELQAGGAQILISTPLELLKYL